MTDTPIRDLYEGVLQASTDIATQQRQVHAIETHTLTVMGGNIRQFREAAPFTSAELAQLIGTNANIIERIEAGKHRNLTLLMLIRIGTILNMTRDDLFAGLIS